MRSQIPTESRSLPRPWRRVQAFGRRPGPPSHTPDDGRPRRRPSRARAAEAGWCAPHAPSARNERAADGVYYDGTSVFGSGFRAAMQHMAERQLDSYPGSYPFVTHTHLLRSPRRIYFVADFAVLLNIHFPTSQIQIQTAYRAAPPACRFVIRPTSRATFSSSARSCALSAGSPSPTPITDDGRW